MPDFLAWCCDPFLTRAGLRALVTAGSLAVGGSLIGCLLLVRRLSLIGDALGHAVLPGVGLAWLVAGAAGLGALFIGGLLAGVIAALGAALVVRTTRLAEDAALAVLFAIASALGVILISRAGTPVDLLHLLYGHLLAVGRGQLLLAAGVSVLTVLVLALGWRPILLECFDPGFHRTARGPAVATHLTLLVLVVLNLLAALAAVGAVLALGLFLIPAAIAYLWSERWTRMLGLAVATALVGSVGGILAAWHLDLPPGPCIVACLGAGFLLSALAAPRHGALAKLWRTRRHREESGGTDCAR
jgi:zinc/manganese transport system permease protein